MVRVVKKVGIFDSKETVPGKISLSEMIIDSYQGHVNNSLVEKMAAKWDESAAGAVILNMREDNTYAVLDGQHRVLAAKKVGVTELNALVFIGKSREEEAKLFVQLNTKHNVSALDRFRANLVAGGHREKNIRAAVREVGLDIAFTRGGNAKTGPDGVTCVAAMINIYDKFGLPLLKTTLGALTSAFSAYPDRRKAYSQPAMIGTAQFIYRYPQANIPRLIEKMRTKSPTVLTAMGETKIDAHSDLWVGWGKMLVDLYNSGLKAKDSLPRGPMERKTFSPKAIENVTERARRVVREWTPEQRAAARERIKVATAARMRNAAARKAQTAKVEKQARLEHILNVTKPLSAAMSMAAKTTTTIAGRKKRKQ